MNAKDATNREIDRLFPEVEESTRLLVRCRRGDFSSSRLCVAVEDCNAHVLNLNVTSLPEDAPGGYVYVELRVNRVDFGAVTRSVERYGYEVVEAESSRLPETDSFKDRINELLHYLQL